MFKNKTNINSKFYLKDKKFNKKNPKYVAVELAKLLSNDLKKKK